MGGPIITLVKWCYSAGKSVFWCHYAMWPTSRAKCLPDPQQQQQQYLPITVAMWLASWEIVVSQRSVCISIVNESKDTYII